MRANNIGCQFLKAKLEEAYTVGAYTVGAYTT